jgi:UDP:flavonoid glycosyltransferase YjiC (YdhE family)
VVGALAHGVPMVLLPIGADQPFNAARCKDLHVARVLNALAATSEDVRLAAEDVLGDATYKRNAKGLEAEIASLPDPEHAVRLFERLAEPSA